MNSDSTSGYLLLKGFRGKLGAYETSSIQMEDSEGSLRKYYSENYFEDKSLEQHFNLTDSDIERFTPKKKKKKKDADENSTTK